MKELNFSYRHCELYSNVLPRRSFREDNRSVRECQFVYRDEGVRYYRSDDGMGEEGDGGTVKCNPADVGES